MSYHNTEQKALLIDLLNQCESDLRELAGQVDLQQQRVLKLLKEQSEEQLLELCELSSQPDYSVTNQYLSRMWGYKGLDESAISETEYQQALDTILHISQDIIDNWPALTPKKVSRLGVLIKGAAQIASEKR